MLHRFPALQVRCMCEEVLLEVRIAAAASPSAAAPLLPVLCMCVCVCTSHRMYASHGCPNAGTKDCWVITVSAIPLPLLLAPPCFSMFFSILTALINAVGIVEGGGAANVSPMTNYSVAILVASPCDRHDGRQRIHFRISGVNYVLSMW